MDRITLRLSPDLVARFDAAATDRGGRSRFVRRLMEEAAQASLPEPRTAAPGRLSERLTLGLGASDLAALEVEARAAGLSRSRWALALIRHRLRGSPQFRAAETQALIEIRRELRRIGVNINQIARAVNTAVLEGAVLGAELAQLAAHQAEIVGLVAALDEAFAGNLDYWRADR